VKVYIAGRISGVKDYGVPFAKAANKFRAQGHIVFDPAHSNQEGRPLTSIMAYLLPQLCSCDTIALLPVGGVLAGRGLSGCSLAILGTGLFIYKSVERFRLVSHKFNFVSVPA
jgi:hypothetical protein